MAEATDTKSTDELFDSLRESGPEPDRAPKRDRKGNRPRSRTSSTSSTSKSKMTDKQLRDQLDGTFVGVGAMVMPFDAWCGTVLVTRGPKVLDALIEVGKVNPRVRQALEAFASTSAWGAVFAAVAGVAVPIAAHHGLVPGELGLMLGPDEDELKAAGLDPDEVLRQMIGGEVADDGSANDGPGSD